MSSRPGKTAPRLLQDLLTYDPRHEERAGRNLLTDPPSFYDPDAPPTPAVPVRNCRHHFVTKDEQSILPQSGNQPNYETVYKIASYCMKCRWHLELMVDFRDDGFRTLPCPADTEFPLHHFIFQGEKGPSHDHFGDRKIPRDYRFRCSAPRCPVHLHVRLLPPRLKDEYITLLTDKILLKKRLDRAGVIEPRCQNEQVAKPVDGLLFLRTYLRDSLQPKQGKGRIPLLNRKFLKTFGEDCDALLTELGFVREEEDDTEGVRVTVWYLPKPPPPGNPLDPANKRTVLEDVRYELAALILNLPAAERGTPNNDYPGEQKSSLADIQRAFGCLNYARKPLDHSESSTPREEDHPYYAGLGAVGDLSDALILFAYNRQTDVDSVNNTYYFECLQAIAIGRNSNMLGEKVQILASQGQVNRRDVCKAYKYFGIQPEHSPHLTDDIIIGQFRSRLSDISSALQEETRNMLRIIGSSRQSERILHEASNAIETYSQALSWLDVEETTLDDFIATMFTFKVNDNPANREIASQALRIIAEERQSQRLLDFINTGSMEAAEMDVSEAYALLGVQDRSAALDLEVLQAQMQSYNISNPQNAAKYEQAYSLICKDQKENHKSTAVQEMGPPKKRHPLESWPVGCQNIGNTCYLNSVLQFLFTIKPLREVVLNFEQYMQERTPEAIERKRVGRSAVTAEKVQKAQEFALELRELFKLMITAPNDNVRPPTRLACLALLKDDITVERAKEGDLVSTLGHLNGAPVIGPMPKPEPEAPAGPNPAASVLADSVMGDDDFDKRTDTSSTVAMADPEEDKPFDEMAGLKDDQGFEIVDKPQPPSRPPPVPPRPQPTTQENTDLKIVEEVARQQDAAEILNNVFDLLSCAMKGEGMMDDGEQIDLIKKLFFSEVTSVRRTNGSVSHNTALQDHQLIWPGDRDRHLYAALDDEFGLQELDSGPSSEESEEVGANTQTTKFECFHKASPILIVNVRRIAFAEGRSKKIESHIGLDDTLYLDRYLEQTKSLSKEALLERREKQWELTRRLKSLESRKAELNKTNLQIGLPDAVNGAADYIERLGSIDSGLMEIGGGQNSDQADVSQGPNIPQELRESSRTIQKETEILDRKMKEIDDEISSLFADCKDHSYRLHSVFIHRGTAAGGHYWIFIHDFQNKIWRKYNDERVDEVEDLKDIFTQEEKYPATSTGIVYVREDLVNQLTEAVDRHPEQPQSQSSNGDMVMQDVVDITDAETQDAEGIPILNGVEKK
ncbi:cysteine proteinase [Delitschia confertaspora ATCC 74209]|uniref:ubiquitinyl hydrolase 1 n=1 Tax=Delitschia confertaspora ATCC 74209 TaxID=1513339 RepID=A0A9P4MPQ3_9PLEO|nr:cysteine proteinase [Delitschia confertaspora ATCC 74209]